MLHICLYCRTLKTKCGRASLFRIQELAGFYGTIAKAVGGLEEYAFRHDKQHNSSHHRPEHQAENKAHKAVFNVLHDHWGVPDKLCSAGTEGTFGTGERLRDKQAEHMLDTEKGFEAVGRNRMSSYIRQHVIQPPLERPSKAKHTSLHTFAHKAQRAGTRQKSKQLQMSKDFKAAIEKIHRLTTDPTSIHPTPQAISTPEGGFPAKSKSDARAQFMQGVTHRGIFSVKANLRGALDQQALDEAQPLELAKNGLSGVSAWARQLRADAAFAVIVDGLSIIQKPPNPRAKTFSDWFDHIMNMGIKSYLRANIGASTVVFIIDRLDDLPHPGKYYMGKGQLPLELQVKMRLSPPWTATRHCLEAKSSQGC